MLKIGREEQLPLSPFELVQPASVAEAISALKPDGDALIRPMGGGTALMLMMKAGVLRPTRLVSLRRLGLDRIESGPGGELRVGAMVSLRALEKSPQLKAWPVLMKTLRTLSNVRVRNVATLGGALAHGDPHMDLPPVLSALGATVSIQGPKGERAAKVEELYAGYLETTLAPGEWITQVRIPALGARKAAYLKCTTRSADDWPALGMAVVLDAQKVDLFLSAATDRPTRLVAAEKILSGKPLDEKILKQAAEAAREVQIDGDLHGSAEYKKHLVGVYLKRAIDEARNAGR